MVPPPPQGARVPLLATCLLAAAACSSRGSGRVVHVDASAPPGGDGASWAAAFDDLQAALAAARPGDDVWVAEGTYCPAPGPGDREATFRLRDGVALYGGFAGNETELGQRDPTVHPTVLSGDLAGDDGPEYAGSGENAYQVVTALHVGTSTRLDGFTIRGGHADGPDFGATPDSREQGAGLNVYFASPRIENCVFEGNWSANHASLNDHGDETRVVGCTFRGNHSENLGAGLYSHHHSSTLVVACTFEENESIAEGGGAYSRSEHGTTFLDCTFRKNRARSGGGLFIATAGDTQVRGCTFEANVAELGGGGIFSDAASPLVQDCTFTGNDGGLGIDDGSGGTGGSGGGGFWANGGFPVLEDCDFQENRASFGGGAYFIDDSHGSVVRCSFSDNLALEAGGLYTLGSDVWVEGCDFLRNTAAEGSFSVGGAISNYFDFTVVVRCVFVGNEAELGGGGVYSEGESATIRESIFLGNRATGTEQGWGGGVMNGYFAATTIANCAFSGNVANRGGAVFNMVFSEPEILNCTLAGDEAPAGPEIENYVEVGGRIANCLVDGAAPELIGGYPVEVRYSLVRGGHPGEGNVDADPRIAGLPSAGADGVWATGDDEPGDLRVLAGSPCIDAGDNGVVPVGMTVDLEGAPRRTDDPAMPDTGLGAPPVVDIGAYER